MLKSLGIAAGLAVLAVAVAAPTDAAICKKKSGVMFYRDACKKKETAISMADLGIVGPPGPKGDAGTPGTPGPAGTARAWAVVDNNGPTLLSSNLITGVTNPQTGVFCLTADASIDPATAATMVSVEWYHSSGFDLLAQVCLPVDVCPEGTFEVKTYNTAGTASNSVAFVFTVL